jgi:hypothetical protein
VEPEAGIFRPFQGEKKMKSYFAMAAIAVAASAFAMKADAMPVGSGLGQAADGLGAVEQAQYIYGGRNYCWYPDGWHGPGFYWCGYHLRSGLGWGGGVGWRGWHHGGGGPRVFRGGGGGPRAFRGGGGGGPRMGGGGGRRGGGGGGGGGGQRRH